MQSLWNEDEASKNFNTPLLQRVYTSRLLGQESSLVLHGGGNTSLKHTEKNIFGDEEEILYVKGSGWDLKTIKSQGFSPVKLSKVKRLATLESLSDSEMVKQLRAALTDPQAPTPSVETILHGIIPFKFVDHTHTDAVVAISNTQEGEKVLQNLYGPNMLILPYCMPGFDLAKQVYRATLDIDWGKVDSIFLLHHGLFTFSDNAKTSYEKMISLVTKAEEYIEKKTNYQFKSCHEKNVEQVESNFNPLVAAKLRNKASKLAGFPLVMSLNTSKESLDFSKHPELHQRANRGPLTPDHVLHTKRVPLIVKNDLEKDLSEFENNYKEYFSQHKREHTCLDAAPRVCVWPGVGTYSLGANSKRAGIISDIYSHTMQAINWAEDLGGWQALSASDIFDVEYWELEQAKLKTNKVKPPLEGKVALVTGTASGIGQASAKHLGQAGASVICLDILAEPMSDFEGSNFLQLTCDITDSNSIKEALSKGIKTFGGIDILVSNAGIFPVSSNIEELSDAVWDKTIDVNLSGHFKMIKECIPFLKEGIDPTLMIVGSKNVQAPGPGVSAYSVSKAGLTQLARVAAFELAPFGISTHVVHPHAVMDTKIWTDEVLEKRAKNYNMTIEEYKKNNLMKVEIGSKDVAEVISTLVSGAFKKTTGLQIPFDGGNDRVI